LNFTILQDCDNVCAIFDHVEFPMAYMFSHPLAYVRREDEQYFGGKELAKLTIIVDSHTDRVERDAEEFHDG
jgi:hypothetical protein